MLVFCNLLFLLVFYQVDIKSSKFRYMYFNVKYFKPVKGILIS